jgi:hypothetical protein
MSDKLERAGTGQPVTDEDIDRAAASLVSARPTPQLYAAIMRRLKAGPAVRPDVVATATLRRWQFAFGMLAVLFVATVVFMRVAERPRSSPPVAQVLRPVQQPAPSSQSSPIIGVPPTPVPPRAASAAPHVSAGSTPRRSVELPRVLSRVTGPRLAERFGGARAEPRTTREFEAPAQPAETAVDAVTGVAPIQVTPLPLPAPVIIPPIVITEIKGRE